MNNQQRPETSGKTKHPFFEMSFRQKIDHLWTYYKGVLIIFVIIAMLFSIIHTSASNRSKHLLSAGITVNASLSQEGIDYLTACFQENSSQEQNSEVYLQNAVLQAFEDTSDYEYNYHVLTNILTMCSSQSLDYLIMDEVGLKLLLVQEIFMDLSEIFTPDELTALGDTVISARSEEESETHPIAVNIADLSFIRDNTDTQKPIYIAFVKKSPRKEVCRQVWDAILAWEQR